ncbi:MAG: TolB-like translocation protein [Planctomycetota bacterium]|jgi:hypothetical protein
MNSHFKSYALTACYIAAVFSAGCFPEESVQWSKDGSIGIVKMDELMGVVDGETHQFTPIALAEDRESTELGSVTISADGKLVAYSIGSEVTDLSEALKRMPANQVKLLEHYAEKVRAQIMEQHSGGDLNLEELDLGPFKSDAYEDFLERYVCENADEELTEALTPEAVEEGKKKEIGVYSLFVASPEKAVEEQPRPLITSIFAIFAPKISPDNRHVAFTFFNEQAEEMTFRFDLFVAQVDGDIAAMHVADFVASAYSWQPDSKSVVFLENSLKKNTDEYSIGTLRKVQVADEKGNLHAEPVSDQPVSIVQLVDDKGDPQAKSVSHEPGSMATHRCTGPGEDLAGVVFHPFMKVQCTQSRIFFSSHVVNLPMNTLDSDLRWSVYCYDRITRSISDILPRDVGSLANDNAMGYFDVSPDEKRILLPVKKHSFMIYKLGERTALTPIEESEEFAKQHGGDWQMMPAWKGSDQITALVSKKSHYIVQGDQNEHPREEVVLFDAEGKFQKVLSESWPRDIDKDAQPPTKPDPNEESD